MAPVAPPKIRGAWLPTLAVLALAACESPAPAPVAPVAPEPAPPPSEIERLARAFDELEVASSELESSERRLLDDEVHLVDEQHALDERARQLQELEEQLSFERSEIEAERSRMEDERSTLIERRAGVREELDETRSDSVALRARADELAAEMRAEQERIAEAERAAAAQALSDERQRRLDEAAPGIAVERERIAAERAGLEADLAGLDEELAQLDALDGLPEPERSDELERLATIGRVAEAERVAESNRIAEEARRQALLDAPSFWSTVEVSGFVRSRLRWRRARDGGDVDLYETASVTLGDPGSDPWSAHVSGSLNWDVDGRADRGNDFAFFSLDDTYRHRVSGHLHHLFVDGHDIDGLERFRLGRQLLWDTPEIAHFDGLHVESSDLGEFGFVGGAYGGLPVHPYESSSDGDALAGVYVEARPWETARVRFEWMHLEDRALLASYDDDLYAVSVWEELFPGLNAHGRFTRLEGEDRELVVDADWSLPEHDLVVDASYTRLLQTQFERAAEIDPLFAALFELRPYQQLSVLVSKGFGERFLLQGGVDVRRVEESVDEGEFNRDYERAFVTTHVIDTLPAELDLALTGDTWDSNSNDVRSIGADLTRRFEDDLRVSLGSHYALFQYDLYTNSERSDVRTTYASVAWKRSESLSLDARLEHSEADIDDFDTLRVGATWRF